MQISEQQVKELHLLYEHTINKKKEKMYDYEMDENVRQKTQINLNVSSCLRKFITNACGCCNKYVGLKYVKRYTTR